MLKWFGDVERIGKERLLNRVYQANVEGIRGEGRPERRWRDEVKDLLLGRGLSERDDAS